MASEVVVLETTSQVPRYEYNPPQAASYLKQRLKTALEQLPELWSWGQKLSLTASISSFHQKSSCDPKSYNFTYLDILEAPKISNQPATSPNDLLVRGLDGFRAVYLGAN